MVTRWEDWRYIGIGYYEYEDGTCTKYKLWIYSTMGVFLTAKVYL
jgi:hypothetical protein